MRMMQLSAVVVAMSCLLCGCQKVPSEQGAIANDSVYFRVQQLTDMKQGETETMTWSATYDHGGTTARFRIELSLTEPKAKMPFSFGKGAFHREKVSDASALLADLAKNLQAKKLTLSDSKTNTLPFTTAVLGRNLSRGHGEDSLAGSFTTDPKGDWLAVKVFVADGEGEFYLNLNTNTGEGEFSMKDPEYGEVVVRELSRVL